MTSPTSVAVDRILVPLDGSESAMPALEHGISLAVEADATVHLVAVVDPYGLSSVAERSEVEAELEEAVTDAAARVQDAGATVRTAVESGFPHEELLSVVDREGIDLIAMGTHGRTGLDRYVLGSVAEKLVRLSPVPVLTVREDATGERPYRNVVVPTDGSDAAVPAERWGVGLADRFGAGVRALSVVPVGPVRSSETTAALEEAATAAVERVTSRATEAGVESSQVIEHGVPHRKILDVCERTSADLVVLGTHGRTGVERFVLGSVAEKVVRLSEMPVLVVPAE
ncbi:universal stress protein [Halobellus clavatus]|uniref:Nucleotide-binding universal stress protein, UspA family n=1 Tax=Halobellus clavatus TaxID=660517 RepID=A0A1H3HYY8_9EURY|nr:universal stress protein [Halobellus clavatus]SDY20690.1 Nucleotide-binding universal stress protein, UspA family [Halobellus clavatus]